MNRITGSLFLSIAASFGVQLYAQQQLDVPSFVDLVTKGAAIANHCADIANTISATAVPADHAAARAAVAANAAAPGAKQLHISQENQTYLNQINVFKGYTSTCGKQLAAVRGPIQSNIKRFSELIANDKLPRSDAQKVASAINAYNDAQKKLVNAILTLSRDRQVESHMSAVIVGDFIEEARK